MKLFARGYDARHAAWVFVAVSDRARVVKAPLFATLYVGWVLYLGTDPDEAPPGGYALRFERRLAWPQGLVTPNRYRDEDGFPSIAGTLSGAGIATFPDAAAATLDLEDAVALETLLRDLPRHPPMKP